MADILLKDVIHLYLGCECKMTKPSYHAVHELRLSGDRLFVLNGKLLQYFLADTTKAELKPILRPLSDMTREDFDVIKPHLSVGVLNAVISYDLKYSDKPRHILVLENRGQANTLTLNDGLVLIREGYDIFNLIPTNQAIDKTTLK